ncbi:MAG: metal-sensitive transcriptional regulator [Kyrpidia sp.]|nr:metal-sensitive transcriptional regulator [Kyrpidia sp.]
MGTKVVNGVHGYADAKDELLRRLRRIEGQVRGVQKMIEEDRYCVDILTQLAAIRAAANKVALTILEAHTRGCVSRAIQSNGGDEAITELMEAVEFFTK